MPIEEIPKFKHLNDGTLKNALSHMRDECIPILDNNLFPHYTDHSVKHSDHLINYIDELIEPISSQSKLTDNELMILYSACYLHDIGMQYERAGETKVIRDLIGQREWKEISIEHKRDLIRKYHHKISAELVTCQISSFGIHLHNNINSEHVACLCDAHCLDVYSKEYKDLMQSSPNIHLPLLSALLRMADILDESSKRANILKSKTLDLDIVSQSHWWRNYYTEDIIFDISNRTVCLYFNFPKQKYKEYSDIIPEIQVPLIQSEFSCHTNELNKVGVGWSVKYEVPQKRYSSIEEMPEDIYLEMCQLIHRRKEKQKEESQLSILQSFKQIQPVISARLLELSSKKDLPKDEYLHGLWDIAKMLEKVKSTRSAWNILIYEYERHMSSLSELDKIKMGLWLSDVLIRDGCYKRAYEIVSKIEPLSDTYKGIEIKKDIYLNIINTLLYLYLPDELYDRYQSVLPLLDQQEKEALQARVSEYYFLSGAMDKLQKILIS